MASIINTQAVKYARLFNYLLFHVFVRLFTSSITNDPIVRACHDVASSVIDIFLQFAAVV